MFLKDMAISWWQSLQMMVSPTELKAAGSFIATTVWQTIKTVFKNFLWVPLLALVVLVWILDIFVMHPLIVGGSLGEYVSVVPGLRDVLLGAPELSFLLVTAFVVSMMRPTQAMKDMSYSLRHFFHPALLIAIILWWIANLMKRELSWWIFHGSDYTIRYPYTEMPFQLMGWLAMPVGLICISPMMVLSLCWLYDAVGGRRYLLAVWHAFTMFWYHWPYFMVVSYVSFWLGTTPRWILDTFEVSRAVAWASLVPGVLFTSLMLLVYIAAMMYGYTKWAGEYKTNGGF